MKKRKYLIFLLMGCLFPCVLWAQNARTQKVTLQLKEASVIWGTERSVNESVG